MTTAELLAKKVRGATADYIRRLRIAIEVAAEDGRDIAAPLDRPYIEALSAQICQHIGLPAPRPHPWSDSAIPAHQRKGRGSVCKKTPR